MAAKSDSELLEVLNEGNKYQSEAIIAAKNELSNRNLSITQLENATKAYLGDKAIDESKRNAPLDLQWKILTFIFPAILTIILSGHLKSGGYDRKAKQLVTWTFYGLGFYAILILLLNLT